MNRTYTGQRAESWYLRGRTVCRTVADLRTLGVRVGSGQDEYETTTATTTAQDGPTRTAPLRLPVPAAIGSGQGLRGTEVLLDAPPRADH
jgi:hypothetical protein